MMISNGYFEFIYSYRNERAYEIYKQSLIERVFFDFYSVGLWGENCGLLLFVISLRF